jgi:hypothetical protein
MSLQTSNDTFLSKDVSSLERYHISGITKQFKSALKVTEPQLNSLFLDSNILYARRLKI